MRVVSLGTYNGIARVPQGGLHDERQRAVLELEYGETTGGRLSQNGDDAGSGNRL